MSKLSLPEISKRWCIADLQLYYLLGLNKEMTRQFAKHDFKITAQILAGSLANCYRQ